MRLSSAAIAMFAAFALGSAPAAAAGLSGIGKAIFGSTFTFNKANIPTVPVEAINVGGLKVVLQNTRLSEVKKAFGGTPMQSGDGSGRADWLCYTTDGSKGPQANVWFISNALGGHDFVMMVAVELANKATPGCEPAPAKLTLPVLPIPGLGASTADLKAKFGSATSKGGAISYRADEPGRDALGTSINVQYIGYLVSGGKVAGFGVGEGSAQVPK